MECVLRTRPHSTLPAPGHDFLSGLDGAWVTGQRDALRGWMGQLGRETLEGYVQTGADERAEWFLVGEPLEEGLHAVLLSAV